jgi:hypothetical protein
MSFDTAVLLKLILDVAHYVLIPWGVLWALSELFPRVSWLQIPVNINTWMAMGILLYVLKLL